ncbi:MAG TPA: putative toxin-antitoxin system toxin component, PIN family [Nitrospirae bacterium]|nr:putative toxin-antitoxin system toxin component, PIN family [Nitrospirota bacterium]
MKVFLDTNVLASALATRGLCEDVLRETLLFHELVIASPILKELEKVLIKKFKVPESIIKEVILFLKEGTIMVKICKKRLIPIKDKDDILILSCALEGKADVFVTGDRELLNLKKIDGMQIISPRDFWTMIKKS